MNKRAMIEMKRDGALTIFMEKQDRQNLAKYQEDFQKNVGFTISKANVALMALRLFLEKEHTWPNIFKELHGK